MTDRKRKIILLACNIFLIITIITAAWLYAGDLSRSQEKTKEEDFIRTVESMKSVSQNYINNEQGYVKDWAAYISEHDMDMEEALSFLRGINTNSSRFVHIVDMDSYEAYSAYYPDGEEKINTYEKYKPGGDEEDLPFGDIMQSMFEDNDDDEFRVLGKYRLQETQSMAVGVGARVTIRAQSGDRDYLMLRIIPVDELRKSWVFPAEYSSAETGIITRSGDYVIQSASMRSQNFIEYIRGYNFQDDYNESGKLRETLQTSASGVLEYKNFRGVDCVWYYSSFGEGSALDILGVISKDEIKASTDVWYIIFLVCSALVLLMIIDGVYLMNMNERLREAARMSEQASKAKTQFLSAMSHDIRTPLNAVLGLMTIASGRTDDPKCVADCMEKGLQSGKHLLNLINDVLDISKIESGSVSLNPEMVCLTDLMHDMISMQEQNIKAKDIDLQSDVDDLPRRYVYADKMRLNQIYMNLFTNAVKYTQAGGRVILRLYEEEISDDQRDQGKVRLIYYLEDNGMGMTEEFQRNMYQNFTREISTQVNNIQGTGLGLAIVKQMVDMMGGTIECSSMPEVGTAFTVSIELPAADDVGEKKQRSEEYRDIRDMRLLVAEDNVLNWEIFAELISEKGVLCDHAWNGQECIEMLQKAPAGTYSAILMDVNMPVMNGYEATKRIRAMKDERLRSIHIIAMTADAFAEDIQKCLDNGMNGHIAKPVDMKLLFSYLERINDEK